MLPEGAILVSHDVFWGEARQNLTMVFRSDDGGATFSFVTGIFPCFWGSLFLHRGALYLLGMNAEYGACLIGRSDDEGQTWSVPTSLFAGGHRDTGGPHRAPMPIVEHEGRLLVVPRYQTQGARPPLRGSNGSFPSWVMRRSSRSGVIRRRVSISRS